MELMEFEFLSLLESEDKWNVLSYVVVDELVFHKKTWKVGFPNVN